MIPGYFLMREFCELAGTVCALASLPGSLELALLTCGALLPRRRSVWRGQSTTGFRLAVVVPAHNEAAAITACLESVWAADRRGLELDVVVVADNCTDETAEMARLAGARVLERSNRVERGKGYALDFAFRGLRGESVDGFAVIDADTEVAANFLVVTSQALAAGADATQCRYLMRSGADSARGRLVRLAAGAFNVLRPWGRERLGLSAGLYGNGFALAAGTVSHVPYAAGSVVEDAEYHLALVRAGRRVRFLPDTFVCADLPGVGSRGADTQRARWEGGRLRLLTTCAPGVFRALLGGQVGMAEPLLDLLLPPLVWHAVLICMALATPWLPLRMVAVSGLVILAAHLLAATRVSEDGLRDLTALAALPSYLFWKVFLLPKVLRGAGRGARWVRTERIGEEVSR